MNLLNKKLSHEQKIDDLVSWSMQQEATIIHIC